MEQLTTPQPNRRPGDTFSFLLSFQRDLSPGPRDAVLTAVGWKALRPPEPRGHSPGRRRGRHRGHQLRRGLENSREYTCPGEFQKGAFMLTMNRNWPVDNQA